MNEYEDYPFQMDEDSALAAEEEINRQEQSTNIEADINPHYEEPDPSSIYNDDQVIRSRMDQVKLKMNECNNEEKKEKTKEIGAKPKQYDEDMDDNLDVDLQNRLNDEYMARLDHFEIPDQPLTPPENFAPVINKIYRSSFPQPNNFSFLKKLKLKSVFCLIPEEYPELQREFLQSQNIKLFQLGMSGNKEPFVKISSELVTQAIKTIIDPANQPILIHCNRGKHRTGCLVGVLRRIQKWSLTIIFDEYRKFAAPKERPMDQQFIELYDETEIIQYAEENHLLPLTWD